MRHQPTILKPNQRMNNRLRMHENFDLLRVYSKIFTRFNEFQGLVKHGSTVNCDALPHIPVWMTTRLVYTRASQSLKRPVSKCPTRCRDNHPLNGAHILANQRLKHSRMLTVNRQHTRAMLGRCLHQELTRSHQRFFIGQSERCALLQSLQSRLKPCRTDNRTHHPVGRPRRRLKESRLPCSRFGLAASQRRTQLRQTRLIGYDSHISPKLECIRRELSNITSARQSDHVIVLRRTPDQIKR